MALDDGRQRFTRAVGILADEKDRIKERLLIAYASQLSLVNAKEDLPPELLNDYYTLRNVLSDADMPYGNGERAAKKLQHMNEDEASALASKIFSIFLALSDRMSRQTAS
jgi:hypothetical protein